jgi:hypothetical protein
VADDYTKQKYTPGPAEVAYGRMQWRRQPYLDRAREMSTLTVPSVFPPSGDLSGARLEDPAQSAGSRGVNNLSSKLLLAMLPPNLPFFRLTIEPSLQKKLDAASENLQPGQDDPKQILEQALAKYEFQVMSELEKIQIRTCFFQSLRQLIIGGNVLLHMPNKGSVRYYPLTSYVVRRDPTGAPLEIYVHERVSLRTLPKEIREQVDQLREVKQDPKTKCYDDDVDLWTGVVREDDNWVVWQETCGIRLEGRDGTYKLDDCHWVPLRFTRLDGEDYGRGMVEDYAGDLKNLEILSEAIAQGSLAAAKVLFLIKPNSVLSEKELSETPNCGFVVGNQEDVFCLQVNKSLDFSTAKDYVNTLRTDLGYVFLLNSAVQRDAERVTAEEIRYVAQELENTLGGVYSLLSEEFQRVLIARLIARLEKEAALPKLPTDIVRPTIITGLDALGRSQELARIERACQQTAELLGPQAVPQYIKPEILVAKIFTANGVLDSSIVRTSKDIAMAQQQQQQQQLAQAATPNVVSAAGQLAANAQQAQLQQQGANK